MLACVPLRELKCLGHGSVEARVADRQEIDGTEDGREHGEDLEFVPSLGVEREGGHGGSFDAAGAGRRTDAVETADEVGDAREFDAAEDLLRALLAGDDAGLAQHVEVLRGGGPAEAAGLHEVTDATLATDQSADDGQSGGTAERLEDGVGGGAQSGFLKHARIVFRRMTKYVRTYHAARR